MAQGHRSTRSIPFQTRTLAAVVACAFPLAVMGQTPPAEKKDDKKETTLPEVKVKSTVDDGFKVEVGPPPPRRKRRCASAVHQPVRALIRSQNATSLRCATCRRDVCPRRRGRRRTFYLRGFPAGGDIFIDGVRDLGEYNRDLFATESVEVLKGPSALIFGRGSTGGIINQTSKIPGVIDRKEVSATFGNFDRKRLTADYNTPIGNDNAVRIVGLLEESGSYRYPQDVKPMAWHPACASASATRSRSRSRTTTSRPRT